MSRYRRKRGLGHRTVCTVVSYSIHTCLVSQVGITWFNRYCSRWPASSVQTEALWLRYVMYSDAQWRFCAVVRAYMTTNGFTTKLFWSNIVY